MNRRDSFASRLGFILVAAGCAVGLGNIWRFPYIAGVSGGAIFVLFYILFLCLLGIPVMMVEFAIGRASRRSIGSAISTLKNNPKYWKIISFLGGMGCYILLSFYTVITGWLLYYTYELLIGNVGGLSTEEVNGLFNNMLSTPNSQVICTLIVILIGCLVCFKGLSNGVEKFTKPAMSFLFITMIVLAIHSISLDSSFNGLSFYLKPSIDSVNEVGWIKTIYNAMTQAFFSLSLGIGAMLVLGSFIDKRHSLLKESIFITLVDTLVAIVSGLIIFPACFSFGISPNSGPTLIFITMLNLFNQMPNGDIWGFIFFFFLLIAALTTVVAVIEGAINVTSEVFIWSRRKSVFINLIILSLISLPIILGFNEWSSIQIMGKGTNILDFADFLLSCNMLPMGALLMVLFCTTKYGWGWNNFVKEVNSGLGWKFPENNLSKFYFQYVVCGLIIVILIFGYFDKFPSLYNLFF